METIFKTKDRYGENIEVAEADFDMASHAFVVIHGSGEEWEKDYYGFDVREDALKFAEDIIHGRATL